MKIYSIWLQDQIRKVEIKATSEEEALGNVFLFFGTRGIIESVISA